MNRREAVVDEATKPRLAASVAIAGDMRTNPGQLGEVVGAVGGGKLVRKLEAGTTAVVVDHAAADRLAKWVGGVFCPRAAEREVVACEIGGAVAAQRVDDGAGATVVVTTCGIVLGSDDPRV